MLQPRRIYDLGLTHKAIAVYCYLCNRADRNDECYPSVRLIAKDLNLARSTVFLAFNPLIAVGICLSANEVPRIAQMFGLDTSVRVNMMSINSTVSMGAKAAKFIAKK